MKFLNKNSGLRSHYWDSENNDTFCKMWSTGGITRKHTYTIGDSNTCRNTCQICEGVMKNKQISGDEINLTFDSFSLQTDTFRLDTTNIIDWSCPSFIEANEVGESIEMIYKQTSIYNPLKERVFKIVYSCKDGKWHKSKPIYGTIIEATEESYEF